MQHNNKRKRQDNIDNHLLKKQRVSGGDDDEEEEEKSLSQFINSDENKGKEYQSDDNDDDDDDDNNEEEYDNSQNYNNKYTNSSEQENNEYNSSNNSGSEDIHLPYGAPGRFLNIQGGGGGVIQQMNQYAQQGNNNNGVRFAGAINNYNQLNNNQQQPQQQQQGNLLSSGTTTTNGDNEEEEEEEEKEWEPSMLENDRIVLEKIGTVSGTPVCFGCEYVGGNLAPIRKSNLECLIKTMYEKSKGTSDWNHSILISEQYEKTIRKPSNEHATEEEDLLPEWPPALVYQHLYGNHRKDLELKITKDIWFCEDVKILIQENSIVEQHITKLNAFGKPLKKLNDNQWRIARDAIKTSESLIKTMKSFKRELSDILNDPHNPFIDFSRKRVFTTARIGLLEKRKQLTMGQTRR